MKNSKSLRSLFLIALIAGCFGYADAAPYGREGRETEWVQPNGKKLKLKVFGDDYHARTETAAGYTVVYNEENAAYHYAKVSADGSQLVPIPVTADKPAPVALERHLDLPKEKIQANSRARHGKADAERQKRWAKRVDAMQKVRAFKRGGAMDAVALAEAKVQAAPFVGDKLGLTILVQFPNDTSTSAKDPINFPTSREKIARYCNDVGYNEDGNTGSVRDFFFDQSGGKLSYTQSVTPVVTMPRARNYYNFSNYPTNTKFRNNSGDLLLTDAIKALKAINFDFSSLTRDATNRVLATNVFFAGPDSGVWAQGLWPYQTTLATEINVGTTLNPIYISAYQQTNINNAAPVIGTFCHENGHLILNYSDLYDYGGESQGAGDHCLMGGGNYNNGGKTPSPINAYFKDVAGWANVVDLASSDSKDVALPTTGNVAYRITKPGTATEYFIMENRGNGDKWAQSSTDKGIAIWHVDELKSGNNEEQMTRRLHYEVSLEQADGKFDLENNTNFGDTTDLFDVSKSIFSDVTKPDAKWWDGSPSNIKFQVLSPVGASTNVHFGPIPIDTIVISSPNGGEVFYPRSVNVINWEANITGNVKIELFNGAVLSSVLSANEGNSGRFVWVVPASLAVGTDYSIKISSITNTVAATDSSDAPFTVTNVTFPANNAMPYGWSKPRSAASSWEVTKSVAFEGGYSLTTNKVADGKEASVSYKSNFKAGTVSFYMKVSSEAGFDFARFFIDGVPQTIIKGQGNNGISGQTPWTFVSYPLTAGTHTLQWTYQKDDSYDSGKDSAWLDGVNLPATTQEIAVTNPVDTELIDGKSTITFPDTPDGSSSKSEIITVKNTGKADLIGLKVVKSGTDSSEFKVGPLGKDVLTAGSSTTFEVTFNPTDLGLKQAEIQILSNDEDEPAFAVSLEGTGLGVPKIAVSHGSTKLKDGDSNVNFGFATVKSEGKTKKITITNTGSAVLAGLSVGFTGKNQNDFELGELDSKSINPGDSASFTVTFKPTKINDRSAGLRIASNDSRTGPFNITLTGVGAPRQLVSSAAIRPGGSSDLVRLVMGQEALSVAKNALAVTSVEVVDGRKYLSLTVAKPAGTAGLIRTVEVSSDLLEWYSGKRHTTTLLNDESTLKVRDNTPVTPGGKRHIRLSVTQP